MSLRPSIFLASIIIVGVTVACRSRPEPEHGSEDFIRQLQFDNWQWVQYEGGAWNPNKRDTADIERAAQFFSPTSNRWAQILLPGYESVLHRIHEPSLFMERTNVLTEEYRLFYRASWMPPVILRFYRNSNGPVLRVYAWSRDSGPGKEGPFMAEANDSEQGWNALEEDLKTGFFWERVSHRDKPEGFDGSRFFLEAVNHGKYHMVDRFGGDDPEFDRICLRVLKKAPVRHGKYFWEIDQPTAEVFTNKVNGREQN